jgi:predicted DNA-binding transcriptional regulator AlpA
VLNPLDDPSRLLKPGEVALILCVSRTQIYRLLRTKLPAIRFGGSTVRVLSGDPWKYIDDHKNLKGQDEDQHE